MIREPGSLDSQQCICAFAQAVKRRLGDEISLSQPVRYNSPLLVADDTGKLLVNRSTENLFIKCWWSDFKSHFRLLAVNLLQRQKLQWYWQFVTDERLKNLYLGNEAHRSKSRKKQEDSDSYNCISDFIGPMFDLVVIRLGYLGWKNQAMAGILKEALLIRQAASKPTWILEQPCSVFREGHFSWSFDVDEFVKSNFEVVDLVESPDDEGGEAPQMGVEGAPLPQSDGLIVEETTPVRRPRRPSPVIQEAPYGGSSDLASRLSNDPLFGGGPKKKKFNRY